MSRIEPNKTPDAQSQQTLDGLQKALGMTPNFYQTLAHSPATLAYAMAGNAALSKGTLGAALREKLALTIAGVNACDYCASAHTAIGKLHKIDGAELANNLNAQSSDAKTQSALTFAKKVVENRGIVSDAELKAVRDAGYTEGEIIEIVATVAVNLFTNYINHIAGTDIDFPLVSTSAVAHAA